MLEKIVSMQKEEIIEPCYAKSQQKPCSLPTNTAKPKNKKIMTIRILVQQVDKASLLVVSLRLKSRLILG
jgi:hypothetical protein